LTYVLAVILDGYLIFYSW